MHCTPTQAGCIRAIPSDIDWRMVMNRWCRVRGLVLMAGSMLAMLPALAGVRVGIETSLGVLTAELEAVAAPITACNFLRYARAGHYDGGQFFRTVRSDAPVFNPVPIDVIQAEAREGGEYDAFGSIVLERTSQTGLNHRAGALSMARSEPDTATSSFFIVVNDSPTLDFGGARNPDGQGFAVFGYVAEGMEHVQKIHLRPAEEEQLQSPVSIHKISVFAEDLEQARAACGTF